MFHEALADLKICFLVTESMSSKLVFVNKSKLMVGHKIDKSCELSGLGQATVSGTTI